ncbi:MAG: PAS domain S-box protein [Syntrophales bacterium]
MSFIINDKNTPPVQETASNNSPPSPSPSPSPLPADSLPETAESLKHLIPEHAYDIHTILDLTGTILYVTPSVKKTTGWSPEEIRHKRYVEWIHPEDKLSALNAINACGKGETCSGIEYRFHCKSGAYIWMATRINPICNEDNIPCRLVSSSRDTTVRKGLEARLLRSEERLRSLIEQAPVGIVIIRNGKFLFINREGLRISGYEYPAEILGCDFEMIIAPHQKQLVLENYQKRRMGIDIPNSYEIVGIRKDGVEIPLHIDAATLYLVDGPVEIYYFRDVTQEMATQSALRESQERLSFALYGNRGGYFDWKMETGHIFYSETYAEILGYKTEDLAPRYSTWELRLHPEDKPGALKKLHDHLEGKTDFYESEHRLLTKSGEYLWVEARARVTQRAPDGRPLRLSGIHRNIAEKKQMEEELQSAKIDLEKRVQERTIELQNANAVLKTLLKQHDADRLGMEGSACENIRGRIQPRINELKRTGLNNRQMEIANKLEEDLLEILSPFLKNLNILYPGLTPKEVQVANLVKRGKTSKDIAEQLNISIRTVDIVRYRIRKKLKISNTNTNLRSRLSMI